MLSGNRSNSVLQKNNQQQDYKLYKVDRYNKLKAQLEAEKKYKQQLRKYIDSLKDEIKSQAV